MLLLAAGVAFAQHITNDFDKARDFSKYKTYTWVKGIPAKSQLNDDPIVRSIEAQQAKGGLRQ
jgi:hypothetical protein